MLQARIEDLKKRLPKHSTPPALPQELEDELERIFNRQF
jgi:hypothetical protein